MPDARLVKDNGSDMPVTGCDDHTAASYVSVECKRKQILICRITVMAIDWLRIDSHKHNRKITEAAIGIFDRSPHH